MPEFPKLQSYDYYERTEMEIMPEMHEYLTKLMQKDKILNYLTFIRFLGTDWEQDHDEGWNDSYVSNKRTLSFMSEDQL